MGGGWALRQRGSGFPWHSMPTLRLLPLSVCPPAGDAFAAGLLYAHLTGRDVTTMGRTAARAASAVISRHGAQLQPEAAAALVEGLPPLQTGGLRPAPSSAALAPSTPHALG